MNYESLKKFLRISRLSIEIAGEINSEEKLKEITGMYETGLSDKQKKILTHIRKMELGLKEPDLSTVKRQIVVLERLMGGKIPSRVFTLLN